MALFLPFGGGKKPKQAAVFQCFQVFRQRLFMGRRAFGMEKAAHIDDFDPAFMIHHDIVQMQVVGNQPLRITVFHRFLDLGVQMLF